jgi:hypothetical protein
MQGCKVLQICAMNVVAKVSHHSLIFLRFLNDALTTGSVGTKWPQAVGRVCNGLQAAILGSGFPLQKFMKIMNILHEI